MFILILKQLNFKLSEKQLEDLENYQLQGECR